MSLCACVCVCVRVLCVDPVNRVSMCATTHTRKSLWDNVSITAHSHSLRGCTTSTVPNRRVSACLSKVSTSTHPPHLYTITARCAAPSHSCSVCQMRVERSSSSYSRTRQRTQARVNTASTPPNTHTQQLTETANALAVDIAVK